MCMYMYKCTHDKPCDVNRQSYSVQCILRTFLKTSCKILIKFLGFCCLEFCMKRSFHTNFVLLDKKTITKMKTKTT